MAEHLIVDLITMESMLPALAIRSMPTLRASNATCAFSFPPRLTKPLDESDMTGYNAERTFVPLSRFTFMKDTGAL